MKPLLSLMMLLKDEASSIKEVLEAVKPHVDRYTIIIDNQSADNTEDIVREVMGDIPGVVAKEKWLGYKESRNALLRFDSMGLVNATGTAKNPSEFNLMLSGDEFLRDGDKLRAYLETQRETNIDCHFIRLTLDTGIEWQARILRTGSKWLYDDEDCGVHEVPVYPDGTDAPKSPSTGGYIEHVVANPIARMDNIWENHIPLLEAALERNPENGRALEFLAQSFESFLGYMEEDERKDTAARCLELYHRRFALPFTFPEHKRFLMMRYIDDARLAGTFTPEQLFDMADALVKADTSRPEAALLRAAIGATCKSMLATDLYKLARHAAEVGEAVRKRGGLNNSSPFDMSTEWKAHRLAAIAACQLAKKHPEYAPLVREHAKAGASLGGPWAMFKGIMDELDQTAESVVTPSAETATG